jgi:hypothetical protein
MPALADLCMPACLAASMGDMVNVAKLLATVQKVAKDPRPYVVASAPVCLVVGAPLAISGTAMLVCFMCSAFGVLTAVSFAAFFLVAAVLLLTLGFLPLAVAAWAFKPKEFKMYSNQALTSGAKSLTVCKNFVDPGSEEPKIALYVKVHAVRRLMVKVLDRGAAGLTYVNSKIQTTEI